VKLYQQHFERVNYNIHTRHVKIHLMSPRIRPIARKDRPSTFHVGLNPSSTGSRIRLEGSDPDIRLGEAI